MNAKSGFLLLQWSTAGWHCTPSKVSFGDTCGATLEERPPVRPKSGSDWIRDDGLCLGWTMLSAMDRCEKNTWLSCAVVHSSTAQIFVCWAENRADTSSESWAPACFFFFMILSKIRWRYSSSGGVFYRNTLWKLCSHSPVLLAVGLTHSFGLEQDMQFLWSWKTFF